MKQWTQVCISPQTTLRDTIKTIDQSSLQIAIVVDERRKLLGTVTDGDLRRGLLAGAALEDAVSRIMNDHPIAGNATDPEEIRLNLMQRHKIHHLPIVDSEGAMVGLETLDEFLLPAARDNTVVLMAGGLGERLSPLTNDCPKPMLPVGGRPILETILLSFTRYGFQRFMIAVNYRAEMIMEYFGDGKKWGVQIEYVKENRRMGTAGALTLLREKQEQPFIVMNGDVLTKVNFSHLISFHEKHNAEGTICVREYEFQVPYGVIRLNGHGILGIEEKPTQKFFVNAGIYVLNPSVLESLEADSFLHMTTIFEKLVEQARSTAVFPLREYWLDVGQHQDFAKASGEFASIFND